MPEVLALTIRPGIAADTRYRILEYIPLFNRAGISVTHHSLLTDDFYRRQGAKQLGPADVFRFVGYGLGRFVRVLRQASCDAVWLGREMFPYGPALLERLLFRGGRPVVLDVDDALFEPDPLGGFLHRSIRSFKKFEYIAPRCAAVVVGNQYLGDYYSRFSDRVEIIPTCVDHEKYRAIPHSPSPDGAVRIGWIGTPFNAGHLDLIRGPLERLMRKHNIQFRIVGLHHPPRWAGGNTVLEQWELARELDYFSRFDIGVMPLDDTPFTRGKCAFKIVQYMAAGIPVVASPVGANRETLENGAEGFLASSPEEWESALERLILDPDLRTAMGGRGRERVAERYSFASRWRGYADIFLRAATRGKS